MRTLLLAGACVIFVSGAALACRGTTEYPEVFQKLDSSTIALERKAEFGDQLSQGQAIHDEGHRLNEMAKMDEGIRILDEIKLKLGE